MHVSTNPMKSGNWDPAILRTHSAESRCLGILPQSSLKWWGQVGVRGAGNKDNTVLGGPGRQHSAGGARSGRQHSVGGLIETAQCWGEDSGRNTVLGRGRVRETQWGWRLADPGLQCDWWEAHWDFSSLLAATAKRFSFIPPYPSALAFLKICCSPVRSLSPSIEIHKFISTNPGGLKKN